MIIRRWFKYKQFTKHNDNFLWQYDRGKLSQIYIIFFDKFSYYTPQFMRDLKTWNCDMT